jgi:CRISPR/Cas system endoribonuclease Cas6 (RAMP superfamily)
MTTTRINYAGPHRRWCDAPTVHPTPTPSGMTAEQLVYRQVTAACGSSHPLAPLSALAASLYDSASAAFNQMYDASLPQEFRDEFRDNWHALRDLARYVDGVADTYRR